MAIMIPDKPKEFEVNSHEDLMFEALATLPDTYYVNSSKRGHMLRTNGALSPF